MISSDRDPARWKYLTEIGSPGGGLGPDIIPQLLMPRLRLTGHALDWTGVAAADLTDWDYLSPVTPHTGGQFYSAPPTTQISGLPRQDGHQGPPQGYCPTRAGPGGLLRQHTGLGVRIESGATGVRNDGTKARLVSTQSNCADSGGRARTDTGDGARHHGPHGFQPDPHLGLDQLGGSFT